LGPKLALSLKDRLINSVTEGTKEEMEKACKQTLKIAEGLVASWSGERTFSIHLIKKQHQKYLSQKRKRKASGETLQWKPEKTRLQKWR
jgi:hypothetical protein